MSCVQNLFQWYLKSNRLWHKCIIHVWINILLFISFTCTWARTHTHTHTIHTKLHLHFYAHKNTLSLSFSLSFSFGSSASTKFQDPKVLRILTLLHSMTELEWNNQFWLENPFCDRQILFLSVMLSDALYLLLYTANSDLSSSISSCSRLYICEEKSSCQCPLVKHCIYSIFCHARLYSTALLHILINKLVVLISSN